MISISISGFVFVFRHTLIDGAVKQVIIAMVRVDVGHRVEAFCTLLCAGQ